MRCALTIKGRVQDKGYRSFIEERARDRRLKGYVFNKRDGTVNVVCEGAQERIDDFVDVINLHEEDDIFVEDILKSELDLTFPMPDTFGRVQTDTMEDVGRKLDIGVGTLKEIKGDTGVLVNLEKGQNEMLSILKSNQKDQKTVIGLLEKIAEK
ncbi:MAG: hypothetical protein A7315_09585 [Candidatus Altiarchaeales archaeon WOR_SM1_79]|nr:MAG: hypothetical protein A7315_09585 [Candidatus Altiarchaeales archaeon WOR_SM1_79]